MKKKKKLFSLIPETLALAGVGMTLLVYPEVMWAGRILGGFILLGTMAYVFLFLPVAQRPDTEEA